MKRLFLLTTIVFALFIAATQEVHASHAYGGEMTYYHEPILPGQPWRFRINVFFYRYCGTGSIAEPASWQVTATPTGCTAGGTPVTTTPQKVLNIPFPFIPVWRVSGNNVVATCPNYPNSCVDQTAAFKTNQIWIYESIIVLNAQCNQWLLCTSLNARNGDITNLVGPGGLNLVFTAMINNSPAVITQASLAAPTNNRLHSPYLMVIPTPASYINQRFDASLGAIDPNGDQLVFSKDIPFTACPQTPVPFATTPQVFTYLEPIATVPGTGGFMVDSVRGQISFTPSNQGKYVACVRASKIRNGIVAGYIRRDIQIDVRANTSPSAPPLFPNLPPNSNPIISGIDGGTNYNMVFPACVNTCYTVYATDPDALNRLTVTFNDSAVLQSIGANYTINITNNDQPSATICWTPDPEMIRSYPYILSGVVRDDYPISGEQSYAYGLYVTPGSFASAGLDVTKCGSEPVVLQATGGAPGASYLWSPPTGLNNPNSPTPIADPATNTCYTVRIENPNGCVAVDTVCVQVNTSAITALINDGADTAFMCIGDSVQLIASGGFVYDWAATPGLSRYDIPNPWASPTATTTYSVTAFSGPSGNPCTSTASIVVFVDNPISVSLPSDTTICRGANIQLNASGGTSYFWTPNYNITNPFSPTPIVSPLRSTMYVVRALSGLGCFATDSINVLVNSSSAPEITVIPSEFDRTVCLGDSQMLSLLLSTPSLVDCGPNPGVNSICAVAPLSALAGPLGNVSAVNPVYNRAGRGTKQQYRLRLSELRSLGLGEGDLRSVSFFIDALGTGADSLRNFTIRMRCVDTTFQFTQIGASYYFTTNTDPVYRREAYLPVQGKNTHVLDIPYYWPGDKDLLIEVCYIYPAPSSIVGPAHTMHVVSTAPTITMIGVPSNNTENLAVCTNCRIQASVASTTRPVIELEGCEAGVNAYSFTWYGLTPLAQSFISPIRPDSLTTVFVPTQTGMFYYRVDVEDTFGCTNFLLDSLLVLDSLADLSIIYPEAASYCFPDTLRLLANSSSATSFTWSAGFPGSTLFFYNNSLDSSQSDTLTYLSQVGRTGYVRFLVEASNQGQCSRFDSVIVRIGQPLNPTENKAYLSIFEEDQDYVDMMLYTPDSGKRIVEVVPFEVSFRNLSVNVDSIWKWTFNKDEGGEIIFAQDFEPKFTFNDDGDYLVTLYSIDSTELTDVNFPPRKCEAKDTLRIIAEAFSIPNTITPNGDGYNDSFRVRGIKRGTTSKLEVYNRWGRPVFIMENYDNSFDGRDLPSGAYFYNFYYSETGKNYTGFLQIIKE